DLKKKHNMALLMITHDLGVVAEICDRVIVMYSGKVVEQADVISLFNNPKHPYTQGLLKYVTSLYSKDERRYSIEGNVPIPGSLPTGCSFAPRCEYALDICRQQEPVLVEVGRGHFSRCLLHQIDEEETSSESTTNTD